jgi:hypothetical protein
MPASIPTPRPPPLAPPTPQPVARLCSSASQLSGRRRRPLKGSPPSATQTERAVFPHSAFMNGFAKSGEKGSVRQGLPCPPESGPSASESVREHQTGLQSFRSMRRIDARRKNASALRFRFSQSFASRRQRLSHAIVRSTTQRRGSTTNPLA